VRGGAMMFFSLQPAQAAIMLKYLHLQERIELLGLGSVWLLRPLMDGQALRTRLSLPPGPLVGQSMEWQLHWQLDHPEGTAEECAASLLSFRERDSR
jgi:tRNA nucleotidyltransferase (CCA-adding enzyme)